MRTPLIILLALCVASGVAAGGEKRSRSAELQSIVDEAGRCAPELEADALLRLAPALGRDDPNWEREALERAFSIAADARIDVPVDVWWGLSTDTDASRRAMAAEFGLDALSLRCRVVRRMLDVDAKRAFELFLLIDREPPTAPTPCETPFVADLRVYYETLGLVASRCFTAKQKARGDDVAFLGPYLAKLASPLEAGPALAMLAALDLDAPRFALAARALKTGLEGSVPDRVACRWAAGKCRLPGAFERLRERCRDDRRLERDLVWAYRKFLVKNLSAPRCVDSRYPVATRMPEIVESFNTTVPEEQEIRAEEIAPSRLVEYRTDDAEWWTGGPSSEALVAVQRLNTNTATSQPFTAAEREGETYRQLYEDAVTKIESWSGAGEDTEEIYFDKKCELYQGLVEKAPSMEERERALAKYLLFLSQSPLARSRPAEWLLTLRYFLLGLAAGDAPARERTLQLLLESREPAVRLYARLADRGALAGGR